MNSFDEIQIEEDAAYYEWLWRQELELREALDNDFDADYERQWCDVMERELYADFECARDQWDDVADKLEGV